VLLKGSLKKNFSKVSESLALASISLCLDSQGTTYPASNSSFEITMEAQQLQG
jgi:hypothetical protein